jgi:hypothetical protein
MESASRSAKEHTVLDRVSARALHHGAGAAQKRRALVGDRRRSSWRWPLSARKSASIPGARRLSAARRASRANWDSPPVGPGDVDT